MDLAAAVIGFGPPVWSSAIVNDGLCVTGCGWRLNFVVSVVCVVCHTCRIHQITSCIYHLP